MDDDLFQPQQISYSGVWPNERVKDYGEAKCDPQTTVDVWRRWQLRVTDLLARLLKGERRLLR